MSVILDRWGIGIVQDIVVILDWLKQNNHTVEDLRNELAEFKAEKKRFQEDEDIKERDAILADPKLREIIPMCPVDGWPLRIVESALPEWEAELVCKCGYKEYLDISVMDYQTELSAKVQDKEVDFKPEDIRVSKEERDKRRAICKECEFLSDKICRKCGCSAKHRTYYEILTCPDRRW